MRDMVLVGFLQAQNCTNFAGSWRHPDSQQRFPVARLLRPHRPRARGRQVPARLLRRSARHAGVPRRALRGSRRARHPLRQDGPDRLPDADRHGDRAARPRLHLLDHLLPPLPRRAAVPDARPDDARARRLERGDLHERRRGAQHGARGGDRARRALRPRRRVHGGRARPLGRLGRRCPDRRQGDGALRRPRQGAPPRPQGRALPLARALHRAALARRATRSSSRPARAAAAGASPRAGAS